METCSAEIPLGHLRKFLSTFKQREEINYNLTEQGFNASIGYLYGVGSPKLPRPEIHLEVRHYQITDHRPGSNQHVRTLSAFAFRNENAYRDITQVHVSPPR